MDFGSDAMDELILADKVCQDEPIIADKLGHDKLHLPDIVSPEVILRGSGEGAELTHPTLEQHASARRREWIIKHKVKKLLKAQKEACLIVELEKRYEELSTTKVDALYIKHDMTEPSYKTKEYKKSNERRIQAGQAPYDPTDTRHCRREIAQSQQERKTRKKEQDRKSQWKLTCNKRATERLNKDKLETLRNMIQLTEIKPNIVQHGNGRGL